VSVFYFRSGIKNNSPPTPKKPEWQEEINFPHNPSGLTGGIHTTHSDFKLLPEHSGSI